MKAPLLQYTEDPTMFSARSEKGRYLQTLLIPLLPQLFLCKKTRILNDCVFAGYRRCQSPLQGGRLVHLTSPTKN